MKFVVFFLLTFSITVSASAHSDNAWKRFAEGDRTAIAGILDGYSARNLLQERDSALDVLLVMAGTNNNMKAEIFRVYFSAATFPDNAKALAYVRQWRSITDNGTATEMKCLSLHSEFELLWLTGQQEQACAVAAQELKLAETVKEKFIRIGALISKGKCAEYEHQKSEAFSSFLDAYYYSLELNRPDLIIRSLRTLSDFFVSNKLYAKAKKYKLEELNFYCSHSKPVDSQRYYTLLSELSDHAYDNGEEREGSNYANRVLSYCRRRQDRSLLTKELAIMRSYYFEVNDFDALIRLYTETYPAELDSLRQSNIIAYYRIRALQQEKQGRTDEAISFLDSAEREITAKPYDDYMLSNFFIRKGAFYLRQKMPQKAIQNLDKAHTLAQRMRYYPFLQTAAQDLDAAYILSGDYRQAHHYRGLTLAYTDSLRQMVNNDEIVLLEMENLEKQKELRQAQIESHIARKHNLQYMLIVILIASSFILLMIAGSFRVPPVVIRSLGYFVFIFFFEFIILLADHKIHHMTHGEPLKIMGLKIILIGMLLPIHHWVEEKVVHYLLHHRLLQHLKLGQRIKLLLTVRRKPIVPLAEAGEAQLAAEEPAATGH